MIRYKDVYRNDSEILNENHSHPHVHPKYVVNTIETPLGFPLEFYVLQCTTLSPVGICTVTTIPCFNGLISVTLQVVNESDGY